MGFKGLLFLSLFGVAALAAPLLPLGGVLGYLGHYYLWPEKQWWGEILQRYDVRVSFTLAALTAVGVLLNWGRLRAQAPGPLLHTQEWLLWAYVGVAGLSLVWGVPENPDYPPPGDPPFSKMFKVALFVFLLTHVATTRRDLQRLLWFVALVGGGYLGWEAFNAPAWKFTQSRLDHFGGPDFAESSFLGAHFAMMGALAGTLLVQARSWFPRLVALVAGGLVFNGLVLTRTRAAYIAVLAGAVAALILADRQLRKWVILLLLLGWAGSLVLTDEGFWERIATITGDEDAMCTSAQSRIQFWGASLEMFLDHPLGVGAGRFFGEVGHYLPEHPGRDTHSTYFRCLAELGIPGILVLLALIVNAFRTLFWCQRVARDVLASPELATLAWGLQVTLVVALTAGCFMTMTYTEELFFLLALPACLHRAVGNAWIETERLGEEMDA